jgi:hypothetical protein
MRLFTALCIFTVLAGLTVIQRPAAAADASPSPLLTTILANYGGREQIAAIRTISTKGQMLDLRKGKEGPYRRFLAKDHKLRTESLVTASSSGDVRVMNNDKGWKNAGQQMTPVQGPDLAALIAQYEAHAFPLTFLTANLSLVYDAPNVIQDHPVETYRLKLPNSEPLTIHFDAISLLIHRVEWQGKNDTSLAMEFSDYRFVDGVLFPFKLLNYADDIKVSEVTISSISLNETLPANTFRP